MTTFPEYQAHAPKPEREIDKDKILHALGRETALCNGSLCRVGRAEEYGAKFLGCFWGTLLAYVGYSVEETNNLDAGLAPKSHRFVSFAMTMRDRPTSTTEEAEARRRLRLAYSVTDTDINRLMSYNDLVYDHLTEEECKAWDQHDISNTELNKVRDGIRLEAMRRLVAAFEAY